MFSYKNKAQNRVIGKAYMMLLLEEGSEGKMHEKYWGKRKKEMYTTQLKMNDREISYITNKQNMNAIISRVPPEISMTQPLTSREYTTTAGAVLT
jgi:hypothetical protein